MINVYKEEIILIEGTTESEVEAEMNKYLALGYEKDREISVSDYEDDEYPFFIYVVKDKFE